jgi:hypothetical protein
MSRTVIKRGAPSDRHENLVDELKVELELGNNVQPAILEEEFPQTKSRHVYVIWDRWSSVADDERTDVILRAYAKLEGAEQAENIALAVGVTSSEAMEIGLLPFLVTERNIVRDFLEYERAKSEEMANTILGKRELRYPTDEAAKAAINRLQAMLPDSQWQIIHEINRSV